MVVGPAAIRVRALIAPIQLILGAAKSTLEDPEDCAEEGKIKVYPLVHQKVVKDRSDFLSRDSISSPTYVSLTLLLVVTYVTRLTQDLKLWLIKDPLLRLPFRPPLRALFGLLSHRLC